MCQVLFLRDLRFSSPPQSHFAFTARAALSPLRCNSQESISTTVANSTEPSADVQLLQYTALCGRRSRCLALKIRHTHTPPPKKENKKVQRGFPSDFGRRKSGAQQITQRRHSSRSCRLQVPGCWERAVFPTKYLP